jgi:protein phosphatase
MAAKHSDKGPEPSNPQEKALWDAFQKFDANGDGKIQAEEFKKLMGSLGSFTSKEIKRLFKEADSDGSGGVDWREFLKWICSGAATKGMGADAAASFGRLLKNEQMDEASFVEQAKISSQVTSYLQETKSQKSEEKEKSGKKKGKKDKDRIESVAVSGDLGVPSDYSGFRLPVPMTHEAAKGLMDHFLLNGENAPLHEKYISYLTTEFTRTYSEKYPKPVVHTETPKPDGRLIIVGDTHGQLADVLHILYQLGPPTASNRYLFNGDMVDRGHQGVEILLLLYSFFLADPESLIIHRGNHENEDMNALDFDSGGGFADEVMEKYGLSAYRNFVNSFKVLSLCSVIEKEIFVVHGGLTRVKALTIDYIDSIDFHDCTAPHPMSTSVKDQIFSDLIWSDPTDYEGKFKSERGVGIKYGPDVTVKFCQLNRLRFMVRSHQVPEDGRGFAKQHDGRCVTVFSASNYCGNGGNYGAVISLSAASFPKYEVFEHFAAPLSEMKTLLEKKGENWSELAKTNQQESQEAATLARKEKEFQRMIIGIIEKKPALWSKLVEKSAGTTLEKDDWAKMLTEFIEGNHPWSEAAEEWGIVDKSGKIEMAKFLSRWIVNIECEGFSSFLNSAVKSVFEKLIGLDMDLEQTFKLFDADGDGTVDLKEARQVLDMFDLGLTHTQLDRLTGQLFKSVGDNNLGRLKVQEFLGRFTMVYSSSSGKQLPSWVLSLLEKIGKLIRKAAGKGHEGDEMSTMIDTFREIDTSGDGILQLNEFVDGIWKLPDIEKLQVDGKNLTRDKLTEMAKEMDSSGDGSINYLEFLQAFHTSKQGSEDLQNSLAEDITTVLFRHRMAIRVGCQYLDEEDSGKVSKEEFIQVLNGVNSALSRQERTLSEIQITGLVSAIATSEDLGDGQATELVDYDAFLRSFVIVDTAKDNEVVKRF